MHPNEELARREIELIEGGDLDGLRELYADDFVLHYPGRNPLAGDHRDLDAFLARFGDLLGDGTLTRKLHDVLGSDDHAVQLLEVSAEVGDRHHSWRATAIYHVRDGRFVEAWIHLDDQYALDDFLNELAR